MIKISALNENPELENRSEEVTKEALEQIALREYAKALDLHKKGHHSDATQLLKDLLDTELLYAIKKPAEGEKKITGPLLNLKYLCYKNLASMLSDSGEIEGAIEAYYSATELDDTDVTLWYRLGLICLRGKRYVMALHAFQRGTELNPKHWPCLDKIVMLLLGLDFKENCISAIYDTLQLDPSYLRGLVYRNHIYLNYPYIKNFMQYLNPIYNWNEINDEPMDEEQSIKLLKEAEDIHKSYLEQQRAEQFEYFLPNLKLRKPIRNFTWESVGESLINMHHYMTDNYYSHACHIEIIIETQENEVVEVCEVSKNDEPAKTDKSIEVLSNYDNIEVMDKEKEASDAKKDIHVDNLEKEPEVIPEPIKKAPVPRDLTFLKQWEWCKKRRSDRKKKTQGKDSLDDNIYNTLHEMVPVYLHAGVGQSREQSKEDIAVASIFEIQEHNVQTQKYFGTEKEHKDVELFISKYTENKHDIINILNDYLSNLSEKWKVEWPENLPNVFNEASKCYNNHIDVSSCAGDNHEDFLHYVTVNLLVEEFTLNEKLKLATDNIQKHDLSKVEYIGLALILKPHILSSVDILELMLRYLWVKLHIHLLNKSEELAVDCLYQLLSEFEAIGEHDNTYYLEVVNFTYKPIINKELICSYIKFLERNKKLSTVMGLYNLGSYAEVLPILLDSFEHYKDMASEQIKEVSLEFAVQLSLILDTYWAMENVDNCFKWSFICLHEALKHYFRCTYGSTDYDKWSLTINKILCCIEHILTKEGLSYLDIICQKDLIQGLEDLIRIIGHQVETNSAEMPFDNVTPWIIMHYILQREEDQGKVRTANITTNVTCDDVPNALMVLFIAHEHLGNKSWCCKSEGKLLYFILDTIIPRLLSPSLSKCQLEIRQYMEQCVYCLFGHPGKKNKLKYLFNHNVVARSLDWTRAQHIYEIFRPFNLPELEGKASGITADTVQLFHQILELIPSECNPRKYVPDIEKYIKGEVSELPSIPPLLPYKMKDIYFLLGNYYFKKEDRDMSIEYNILDVIVSNNRLESWAEISLAKASNLQRLLNSCENLNNEKQVFIPAKSIIRCFERSLKLDPTHCNLWIEYGIFVYTIHSFCSRLLKQASESLSMDDFEFLDKQKEDMLDATQKCFTMVQRLNNGNDSEKDEDSWIPCYMLGKVAEKRNKHPSVYLNYYQKSRKNLEESGATYPLKINYDSPTHLCNEVLEVHYRIHASILKYIEQHEEKPIPTTLGKVFSICIESWKGSTLMKKLNRDETVNTERKENLKEPVHEANDLKRSVSDLRKGDTPELKKTKLETGKFIKSASFDVDKLTNTKYSQTQNVIGTTDAIKVVQTDDTTKKDKQVSVATMDIQIKNISETTKMNENNKPSNEKVDLNKEDECSDSISSSTDSSSSVSSSSDEDQGSGSDSDTLTELDEYKILSQDEIAKIISACLDALEDCASRFSPNYKALYRLAHYHFYYKKCKYVERCRNIMLSIFTSRFHQKLGGLFNERKSMNFFNNIWKIPSSEIDRAGSFAYHMNRSVLLVMEVLKETDDHKTLLDVSLCLQREPNSEKKYLRDSDREELAQQALNLCVLSLKGQLLKFSQQANLHSNDVERERFNSLMLDIYGAYQKTQKQQNSKQFINLLVDGYKLVSTAPLAENTNLVDISMKYCQANKSLLKKQTAQIAEITNATSSNVLLKPEPKKPIVPTSKLSKQAMPLPTKLPIINSTTTAASLPRCIDLSTISNFSRAYQNSQMQSKQCIGQSAPSFDKKPPPTKQKRDPKTIASVTKTSQMKPSKSLSGLTIQSSSNASQFAVTNLQKSTSTPIGPSMGTISSLPSSVTSNLALLGTSLHASHSRSNVHGLIPKKTPLSKTSTVNAAAIITKPPLVHQKMTSKRKLQEKLTERQNNLPSTSIKDINASINKLSSSVTITKTSVAKKSETEVNKDNDNKIPPLVGAKGIKKKQTSSDEIIVLDDD